MMYNTDNNTARTTLISLLMLFLVSAVNAQNPLVVMGGEKGNYILNPFKVASEKFPEGTVTGFKLERSADNGATFTPVSTFSTPQTLSEYKNNLQQAIPHSVFPQEITESDLVQCWLKFSRSHKLDSIRPYLNYQHILLALNILVLDMDAEKGKPYLYRLSSLDKNNAVVESKTSAAVQYPAKMHYDVPRFRSTDINQHNIILTFKVKKQGKKPNHFAVYRKQTSSLGAFEKIGLSRDIAIDRDSFVYTYTDHEVSDAITFFYYISPSDQFGNYNICSDTIAASVFQNKNVLIPNNFKAVPHDSSDAIKLSWNMTNPYAIGSIQLFRNTSYEGNYTLVSTFNAYETSYTDRGVLQGVKYYYFLRISDKLGRQSIDGARIFGIVSGVQGPGQVALFTAKNTDKGVTLQWLPNGNNIRGFHLYKTYQVDGKPEPVGNFIPYNEKAGSYTYIDTVKVLKPDATVGYTITQENAGHIEGAPFAWQYITAAGSAMKATSGIQVTAQHYGHTVLVTWKNTMNNRFSGYNLYRKNLADARQVKINKALLPPNTLSYTDTVTALEKHFSYIVEPVYVNGSTAKNAESNEIVLQASLPQAPVGVAAALQGNTATISWEYYKSTDITGFDIYSWQPGEEPVKIGSADKDKTEYKTTVPENFESAVYFVKAINAAGESSPSNNTTLRK